MTKLGEIVQFRSDMLFQGAVDLSWFNTKKEISHAAARAFVFHGPHSHSFSQNDDFGVRKPIDTATFAHSLISRACGKGDTPFAFAIAGYGTGKSHFALALAELLHAPNSAVGQAVLHSISTTDENIGNECLLLLKENSQPSLVVTLNGMGEFNLVAAMTSAFIHALQDDGEDTSPVEALRPRFERAANMLSMLKDDVLKTVCEKIGVDSIDFVIEELRTRQNEKVFEEVACCLQDAGCPLEVAQLESLKELFSCIVDTYCGENKKYKSVIIFFDEFGKYLEFAIGRPVIAGSGVLQDLFEAVQSSHGLITFTGFIQFELKAYVQRLSSSLQNEASRYITRYDNADKKYLSTNMETIVANIIEKKDIHFLSTRFDNDRAYTHTAIALENLQHYFKEVRNYPIWNSPKEFHAILCKNCWPLSPYALWFFLALASGSRFLQERSILSLLNDFFKTIEELDSNAVPMQGFSPAHLFSDALLNEFVSSEKFSEQGAIAHSLASVLSKHDARLNNNQKLLLKTIVIAEKLGLIGVNKADVVKGLCLLCNLSADEGEVELNYLQNELNVIEWDDSFKTFDILSDAIPRTQFISFLRQRLDSEYDEEKQTKLFEKYIDIICPESLKEIDTDFGEEKNIQTNEWKFSPVKTNEIFLELHIKKSTKDFSNKIFHNEAKGVIIYVYLSKNSNIESVKINTLKYLKDIAKSEGLKLVPIIVAIFHDTEGKLGQYLAEYDILENLNAKEKEQFSNLVPAHREKISTHCIHILNDLKKQCTSISLLQDIENKVKFRVMGMSLFEKIYPSSFPFPFDGFTGTATSGTTSAYEFSRKLIFGALDFNKVTALPSKDKNRATTLFQFSWGIYDRDGRVVQRPKNEILATIFKKWDAKRKEKSLFLTNMMAELLAPPYGANTYSALVAISVYISARISSSYIKSESSEISPVNEWATTLFTGTRKKVDRDFFGHAEFVLSRGESQEWEDLLNEWEDSELFDELVLFPGREKALRKKTPFMPELYDRLQSLQEKSKNAGDEKNKYDMLYEKAYGQIEVGNKQEKLSLVIAGSANLHKMLNTFSENPNAWLNSEQRQIENDFSLCRQEIIRNFDEWAAKENPRSERPEDIAMFKERINKIITQLKNVNLLEYSEALAKLLSDRIKNAEIVAQYKRRIEDAEKFLQLKNIQVKTASMQELKASLTECMGYIKDLEKIARNRDFEGLKEMRIGLANLKELIENRQKKLKTQLSAVMNYEIVNIASIELCLQEFEKIRHLFIDEVDFQDILDSESFLKWLANSMDDLGQLNYLESEFEDKLSAFSVNCEEYIEEKELVWSHSDIFNAISNDLRLSRESKSKEWITTFQNKCENISLLTTSQALSLKNDFQIIPSYVSKAGILVAHDLYKRIDEFLETKKIEWLVQEFNSLSKEQKNKVLEKIIT